VNRLCTRSLKPEESSIKFPQAIFLKVEKLDGAVGDTIELNEVLMVGGEGFKIGTPLLPNAKVRAPIVEHGKDKKILVFKSKRRTNYRTKYGHRQPFTRLKITNIEA